MTRIVIIGGGPAGYEAALVAAQLDADVTVVEADGRRWGVRAVRLRAVQDLHRQLGRGDGAIATPRSSGVRSDGLEAVTVDAAGRARAG